MPTSAARAPERGTPVVVDTVAVPVKAAPTRPASPAPVAAEPQVHLGANARDQLLLRIVAQRGEVSCKLVQDELGWSRSTARDVLARLVGLGRLRRTAEDPRPPSQSYLRA